jgi:hypothetical protein
VLIVATTGCAGNEKATPSPATDGEPAMTAAPVTAATVPPKRDNVEWTVVTSDSARCMVLGASVVVSPVPDVKSPTRTTNPNRYPSPGVPLGNGAQTIAWGASGAVTGQVVYSGQYATKLDTGQRNGLIYGTDPGGSAVTVGAVIEQRPGSGITPDQTVYTVQLTDLADSRTGSPRWNIDGTLGGPVASATAIQARFIPHAITSGVVLGFMEGGGGSSTNMAPDLVALSLADGSVRWRKSNTEATYQTQFIGDRVFSPTYANGSVSGYDLLDAATGAPVGAVPMTWKTEAAGGNAFAGFGETNGEGYLWDRSGNLLWQNPRSVQSEANVTNVLIDDTTPVAVVVYSDHHVLGLDTSSGAQLWSIDANTATATSLNLQYAHGNYLGGFTSGAARGNEEIVLDARTGAQVWAGKNATALVDVGTVVGGTLLSCDVDAATGVNNDANPGAISAITGTPIVLIGTKVIAAPGS